MNVKRLYGFVHILKEMKQYETVNCNRIEAVSLYGFVNDKMVVFTLMEMDETKNKMQYVFGKI